MLELAIARPGCIVYMVVEDAVLPNPQHPRIPPSVLRLKEIQRAADPDSVHQVPLAP